MAVQLSTMITRLQKEASSAAGSGRANADVVADLLNPRLAALVPDGEPVPDLIGFQLVLSQLIQHDHDQLLEIDASHVAELTGDRGARFERDAAFDELFDQLSAIQDAWNGVYVDGGPTLFGGVEVLPRDPVALHRLGARVHGRLTVADFVEPEPRLVGQSLNRDSLAVELGARVDRLGTALAGLGSNVKESDKSLRAKQEAFDVLRRTVRFAAGCLAGLYGLAGLDDLAEKVLPKRRASRRSNGGTDGPPPEETSPDGPVTPPEGGPDPAAGDETGDGAPPNPPLSGPLGIVS
jgi:hypothetical protein